MLSGFFIWILLQRFNFLSLYNKSFQMPYIEKMCAGSNLKSDVLRKAFEEKSQKHIDLVEILRQPEPLGFQVPTGRSEVTGQTADVYSLTTRPKKAYFFPCSESKQKKRRDRSPARYVLSR